MRIGLLIILLWTGCPAWAQLGSLMGAATDIAATEVGLPVRTSNSLFVGAAKTGLLAPYPKRQPKRVTNAANLSAVQRVRYIIGRAESPHMGYDAVQHGARIKPAKLPTQMTIGEIYNWIAATPGQPHAIGRYQFIPDTLRRVVGRVGARRSDLFTPQMQDRLADVLLADADMPLFMAGQIGEAEFIDNLAAIWAGLPTSTGRSKYHGVAGNKATVTLAYLQSEVAKLRPG